MLLCYNSQSIFSVCILNLSNIMESDGLIYRLFSSTDSAYDRICH